MEKLCLMLKKNSIREVPRIRRFAVRSSQKSLLANTEGRQEQDLAIGKACHDFGYTQAEEAAAALHYSTVSQVGGKEEKSRFKI
jgi:hypothetical protein